MSRILFDIPKKHRSLVGEFSESVEISTIINLYDVIRAHGDSPLHASLCEVLTRLLEGSLLRDDLFSTLMERWNALIGKAPELIRERIYQLTGSNPSAEVLEHFLNILGGTAVQRGRRKGNYEVFLPSIFQEIAAKHPRREIRCNCCGYHFLEKDLGQDRKNLAIGYGLVFSPKRVSARLRDELKPVSIVTSNNERSYMTGLTIEHIIPEEGLGPSSIENLEILCKFCNNGKLATRWALEPISSFVAGGTSDYPANRTVNVLMQTVIVSAIRLSGGRCKVCGKNVENAELTVRPINHNSRAAQLSKAFSPWNLECVCYACHVKLVK